MLHSTNFLRKNVWQMVLTAFFTMFVFSLNAQNTGAVKNLIGKRLEGLQKFPHIYGIQLKNDSILTIFTPELSYGGCNFIKEEEQTDLKYFVKNDTISLRLIMLETHVKCSEEEEKLLEELGWLEKIRSKEQFMKTLLDSPLVITKNRDLETTYLSNGSLHYFEVNWLEKQPTNMLMYSDAKDYVEQTGTKEDIEKKFEKLLTRIRREEKKSGKKLYEIQRLSPSKALHYYNIVVRNELISVIFIEQYEE